jgi:hypothetical protein
MMAEIVVYGGDQVRVGPTGPKYAGNLGPITLSLASGRGYVQTYLTHAQARELVNLIDAAGLTAGSREPVWPIWETACGCTVSGQHVPEGDGMAEPYGNCAACGAIPLAN